MARGGSKLVFDIGLHNGDDTAFYVHSGYRVVGVEANPHLVERCRVRFQDEIAAGLVQVVQAGILKEPGTFTFYRNLKNDLLSSFDPARGQEGGEWDAIEVPCHTIHQLIAKFGTPFFTKIDIEGADYEALNTLSKEEAPAYISVELNKREPILERLIELGYTAFKFVNGETHGSSAPIFHHEIGWRLMRKLSRVVPPVRTAISLLPEWVRCKTEFDLPSSPGSDGYAFTTHSSGAFGEDASGQWLDIAEAQRRLGKLIRSYNRAGEVLWWDVHGRHGSRNRQGSESLLKGSSNVGSFR